MTKKEKEIEPELEEALRKWIQRFMLIKFAGYAIFGITLALFIISAVLQIWSLNEILTTSLLVGVLMIIIGRLGERWLLS